VYSSFNQKLTDLGYLVAAGWQFSIVSTAFLSGTILQGLLILNYEDSYTYEGYHGTLLVIAITVFCIIFNVFLAKRLPFVEGVLLVIYIVGFFVIIIPLWVLAPRTDSETVFTKFNNEGGWNSYGTAFLVGISGLVPSMAGFDCKSLSGII
jgi:amino acid transporter